MRILCISEDTPFIAGGRLVFFRLCRALEAKGHVMLLLTGKGATEDILGPSAIERRIHTPRVRILGPFLLIVALLFEALKEARRFELIFVNAGVTVPVAVLAGFTTRRRVVELHHDVLSARELIGFAADPSRKVTALLRWVLNYVPLRFVSGVAAVSPYTVQRLRAVCAYQGMVEVVGDPVE